MTALGPRVSHTAFKVEGQICLQLTGEIDLLAEELVISWFRETLRTHPGHDLVVDLSGLSFLDSSGIRCLVDAHREFGAHSQRLTVTGAQGVVATALRVTGVYDALCGNAG